MLFTNDESGDERVRVYPEVELDKQPSLPVTVPGTDPDDDSHSG